MPTPTSIETKRRWRYDEAFLPFPLFAAYSLSSGSLDSGRRMK